MFLNLGLGRMGCLVGALASGPALDLNFIDGSDFSSLIGYTRTTPATQFYSDGRRDWAPENLLLRSQDLSNASWTKGANASVSADAASPPVEGAQVFLVTFAADASTADVWQAAAGLAATQRGTASVWVKTVDAATVQFFLTGSTAGDTLASNAAVPLTSSWSRVTLTAATSTSALGLRIRCGSGQAGKSLLVAVPRIQRGAYSLASDDKRLQTTSAAVYGPRRNDYDPATLAIRGFQIEEQRTNLALQSGNEADAAWTKTATSIGTGATGLDGVTASRRMTSSSTTPLLGQTSITVTASTTYTYSVALKYVDTNWLRIQYMDSTFTNGVRGWVNLNGGGTAALGQIANVGTGTGAAHTLTDLGGGWWLYTLTGMAGTATAAGPSIRQTTGDNTAIGLSGVSYDADGHQLEAGAFATSYMPTGAASAVRAADVGAITGANFTSFYNAAAGTIAIEATFMAPAALYATAPVLGGVGAGSFGEDIYFARATSGDITSDVVDGGVSQASLTIGNVTGASTVKVAISYAANNLAACCNGGSVLTDTSATLPTVTSMSIGKATWASGNLANAWIRRVRYFNRTSTGPELVALTA